MRVFLDSPSLSLRLYQRRREHIEHVVVDYDDPPEQIAELSLIGLDMKFSKEMSGKADINIDLRTIFLLYEDKQGLQ